MGKFRIISCFVVGMVAVSMMSLCAGVLYGQDYPNRPVRVLTAEAGGGNDFAARQIALGLTSRLNQQVIVENKPGASQTVGADYVAKANRGGIERVLL